MNVKKMFAGTAGMLLLAQMVLPVAASTSVSYGEELTGAYLYAYDNSITTIDSIEKANMYGQITRGQLAKMISNWAKNALGRTADETKVCNFPDANTAEGDLAMYVKMSCQMGLMGQGIKEFRPNANVTRGEFGTTLSRALWGAKYDTTANPYYKLHLQALKEAGIMTKIETPNQLELRGYVMLMLQRAHAKEVDNNKCSDPVVVLACTLGTDNCPADCKTTVNTNTGTNNTGTTNPVVVKSGDLGITVTDYSSAVKTAPKGIFVANAIRFLATENVTLDSLTLKRSGLSTRTDIDKVWLERNGVAVTNAASIGSDGLAVLNFKNGKNLVTADVKTQDFDLVVKLKSTAATGNEIAFELVGATASAKNIVVKGMTTTYRIAGYSVVSLTVDGVNKNKVDYTLGNQPDFVIGQFVLDSNSKSDDRDIFVRSLTFRNAGSIDFASTFKNVRVYRDSKVVSNGIEINGRDITVTLDKDVIKANKRALYTIRAEVANLETVGQDVQLQLKNTGDIIADESDTGFRANVSFGTTQWASWPAVPGMLAKYVFNGGRVVLETQKNFPRTVEAGQGANDVTIAAGKITTSENVELPKIEITYDSNFATPAAGKWTTNDPRGANTIKRLVLEVGGSRYTADNSGNGTFTFEGVYVRNTSDIKLLISIDSQAKTDKEIKLPTTLSNSLMSGVGEYQSNSENLKTQDIAGAINVAKVLIKESRFQLIANNISTQSTVVGDSTVKTLMSGKLSSKDKTVNVNSFTVKANSALPANTLLDLYLDVNGQPFSNATLNSTTQEFTFNSLGTINAGSDMTFEIKVQPNTQSAQDITLEVQAKGTDSNGNSVATSVEYSAKLEVKANASIEVTNAVNSSDRVVEPTVNAVLYEGTLNVKNGATELTSFKLDATPGSDLTINNYKLYVDGEFVADSTTAEFAALSQNLEEGKRVVAVKANVQSAAGTTPENYNYKINKVVINGTDYVKVSNTYFAKGFFLLAKEAANTNGELKVKLTNTSSNTVEIKSLTLNAVGDIATASVNGQAVEADGSLTSAQSVPAGASIEIVVVAQKDKLVKLEGVEYTVTDGNDVYTYALTKDNTSVGSWGTFFSNL